MYCNNNVVCAFRAEKDGESERESVRPYVYGSDRIKEVKLCCNNIVGTGRKSTVTANDLKTRIRTHTAFSSDSLLPAVIFLVCFCFGTSFLLFLCVCVHQFFRSRCRRRHTYTFNFFFLSCSLFVEFSLFFALYFRSVCFCTSIHCLTLFRIEVYCITNVYFYLVHILDFLLLLLLCLSSLFPASTMFNGKK